MKRLVADMSDYHHFWAYTQVIDNGYKVKVNVGQKQSTVKIMFDDGDIYASFKIVGEKIEPNDNDYFYMVYADNENITAKLDYTQTMQECICGCFAYFAQYY